MARVCLISNMNVDGTQFDSPEDYQVALARGCGSIVDHIYPQLDDDYGHHLYLNSNHPAVLQRTSHMLKSALAPTSVHTCTVDQQRDGIIVDNNLIDLFNGIHPVYASKLIANARQFCDFLSAANQQLLLDPLTEWFVRIRPDTEFDPRFRIEPFVSSDHSRWSSLGAGSPLVHVNSCELTQNPCPGRRLLVQDQIFSCNRSAVVELTAGLRPWIRSMAAELESYWDLSVPRPQVKDRWYNETAWGKLIQQTGVELLPSGSDNLPGVILRPHHMIDNG